MSAINLKNFPKQIRIENTTNCNAVCTICPREKLTRPKGTMSFENFCSLIDQIPSDELKDLHLQGFGEPLLDKDFIKKIHYARKKLPSTRLFFVTNASLLKGELAKDIILSGVDKIRSASTEQMLKNMKTSIALLSSRTSKKCPGLYPS